jgi:hypothetical protein
MVLDMYSGGQQNEAFRLISEGFCIESIHSKSFAVKRKVLDQASGKDYKLINLGTTNLISLNLLTN